MKCGAGGYPVDERLGTHGRYSKQAQRLVCLAAASWSYDISSDRLQEFCGLSVASPDEVPRSAARQQTIDKQRNSLSPHADHLHDAERLKEGRSIGSGQIEVACKNLIGRRLKSNAARWRVRRINRMAGLCSHADSDQWAPYRETR